MDFSSPLTANAVLPNLKTKNPLNTLTRSALQASLTSAQATKFTADLFQPTVIDATKGGTLQMEMRETQQWLGLVDASGKPINTTVWTYGQKGKLETFTYPGPTIVASRDNKLNVTWDNKLPIKSGSPYPGAMQYDSRIHLAKPTKKTLDKGYVPLVTHLHGGHTESASDGIPEAWYTQNNQEVGPDWKKSTFTYDNDQQAGTLFYHDHALGLTRLNVYAGLAGFYLERDANINDLFSTGVLPSGKYEVGLAIQDKTFTPDGQLFYPQYPKATDAAPPEFYGNNILVNGRTWPKLSVDKGDYLFHFLNGSDSRPYTLDLKRSDGRSLSNEFTLVGKDGGLLPKAVNLDTLTIYPGERYDVVIDLSSLNAGETLTLKNSILDKGAYLPSGTFDPTYVGDLGDVMQFQGTGQLGVDAKVIAKTVLKNNTTSPPPFAFDSSNIRADNTRKLALFEGTDPNGIISPFLGTVKNGSLLWDNPVTEDIKLGSTEKWVIYNTTIDPHPIHLHLVNFQVLSRENFKYTQGGLANKPMQDLDGMTYTGKQILGGENGITNAGNAKYGAGLRSYEAGAWQDTVVVQPGEAITLLAKFDRPGEYVWHCHILSHEDNEMMRPFVVS